MSLRWKLVYVELIPLFFYGVAAFSTLMIAALLLRPLLVLLVDYNVNLYFLMTLFFLGLPPAITYALPMGTLMASLMSINRLSSRGELTALFAAGQSFLGVQAPIALFGCIISILGLYLNETVNPKVAAQSERIQAMALGKKYVTGHNVMVHEYQGGEIYRSITARRIVLGCLDDVAWIQYREYKIVEYVEARRACPTGANKWRMEEARVRVFKEDGSSAVTDTQEVQVDFTHTIEEVLSASKDVDELTFKEALKFLPKFKATYGASQPERVRKWTTQMYMKLSVPFVALIFALLGSALGLANERSGGSIGMGISVLVALMYYI
ncbi:MAG: LptF/LptG family permease, partial [bacterium]